MPSEIQSAGWLGAPYARISVDKDDLQRQVGRQQEDNRAWAGRHDIILIRDDAGGGEQFVDDDISASKYSRKKRHAYIRLLAAVEADDRIKIIVAYHLDRVLRRPDELEDVVKLAEARGGLWLGTETMSYDFCNPEHLTMLRVIVAMAAQESANTSRRVGRDRKAQREQRQLAAGPIFGWTSDGRHHHGAEAPVVVDMVERLLAGETLGAIAAWLNAGNIPLKRGGKKWSATTVKGVVSAPRHYGHYSYRDPKTKVVAILQRDTHPPMTGLTGEMHDQVMAVLARRRGSAKLPNRRSALTGLVHCGICGEPMSRYQNMAGVFRLGCMKRTDRPERCGKVHIRWADVYDKVTLMLWERVDTLDLSRMVGSDKAQADAAELTARLLALDDQENANIAAELAGEMSRERANKLDAAITAKREAIHRQMARLATNRVLRPYAGQPGALAAAWPKLSDDARREIIAEALALEKLRIEIDPGVRGRAIVDRSRIQFRPVQGRRARPS